jgi:hypothetical protein
MTLTKLFTQIANAIREKKGTVGTIIASNFPNEILEIGGGGFPPDWSEIGYEETPSGVIDGFNYAKEIKDNWDSSIVAMTSKYYQDKKLTIFPMVDTSNVTTMGYTFSDSSLMSLPLLDTSNVTNFQNIFSNCTALKSIPLLNTSKVTMMTNAFNTCKALENIPLLDTSNVISMEGMFAYCQSLESVPLFNTGRVVRINTMFRGCKKLKSVPLFDTHKVSDFTYCFVDCKKLEDVPVFDMSSISSSGHGSMFGGSPSLTDESLNNILQMFINATDRIQTKTLKYAGFTATNYPVSRIQALSNYQAFIDAGWTIGY